MRWLFFNVFIHPTRLKLALLPARLLQKIGVYGLLRRTGADRSFCRRSFARWSRCSRPTARSGPKPLPEHCRRHGLQPVPRRCRDGAARTGRRPATDRRVGFFAGCIGSVMFDDVNRQAVELLAACRARTWSRPGARAAAARSTTTTATTARPRNSPGGTSTRSCPTDGPARRIHRSPTSPGAARCCGSTTSCCATTRSTPSAPRNSRDRVRDISEVLRRTRPAADDGTRSTRR